MSGDEKTNFCVARGRSPRIKKISGGWWGKTGHDVSVQELVWKPRNSRRYNPGNLRRKGDLGKTCAALHSGNVTLRLHPLLLLDGFPFCGLMHFFVFSLRELLFCSPFQSRNPPHLMKELHSIRRGGKNKRDRSPKSRVTCESPTIDRN